MGEDSLLLNAAIYLLAAVAFVPTAARFGLGSVIGYLIAGCVIGPFGLGLVRDVDAIFHFAEFGVVLMLFVIGLELDLERLWELRRSVFVGGAVQMVACGVVFAGAGMLAGLPPAAAIVAGLSLALSSTAVAAQTMAERGVLASPTGRAAFGVLLFQDLAAIPLIAVVPLLATGPASAGAPWLGVLKVAGAILTVVGLGRFVVLPVMRAIARVHLRDVFTAFALLVVIATALLMQLVGVSMALGAFLAGVLLASSEYRHALETDIEGFRGLLMGLFFIAVGMSIDFGLLAARPALVLGLVAGFVTAKFLLLLALGQPIGVPRGVRPMFAGVLSQGSEFAFVVFGVAGATHVLPGEWNALLTLVVALSMLLAPLTVLAADRLQRRLAAATRRPPDDIEPTDDQVIIVGFGRFGQIVGRLLFASGIRATVLDHDPDNIDLLRRLGFRVFYGDGTRVDLLTSAGAARASVLVNAIDDTPSNLKLVDVAQRYFPSLPIVARVRDVSHWRELRERGVERLERETFESALRVGRHALESLGVRPYEARERADAFRRHNVTLMEDLLPNWADEAQRISAAREGRLQFEQQFQRDLEEVELRMGQHWHRVDME